MSVLENEIHDLLFEILEDSKKIQKVCRRMLRRYKSIKLIVLEHNIDY